VAGRTIQGLGGGGLVPVTLALVADMWPPGRRGAPLGAVGAVQELGSVLGPLYGAVIVEHSSWRTIFWINVPLSFALGLGFLAVSPPAGNSLVSNGFLPRSRRTLLGGVLLLAAAGTGTLAAVQPAALASDVTWGQLFSGGGVTMPIALIFAALLLLALALLDAPRRVAALVRRADWTGALLLAGALACIIITFASSDAAQQVLSSSAEVVLPIGALLAILFVLRETRTRDPLVPLDALADRAAFGSLLVNLAVGAALMAALVDVPIFARATAFPNSQLDAALVLVRFLAAVPIGALLGGLLTERLSHRITAAAGMSLTTAMFAVMSTWPATALSDGLWQTHITRSDAALVGCGLGFGLAIAPVNAAMLGAVRATLHGLASALVVVARMIGMLVGLSVLTAVGLRAFYATEATIPSPLKLCPQTPAACPAYDALVKHAIIDELHTVFVGAALCAGAAALLALALLRRRDGQPAHSPVVLAMGTGG
jgi:MFS family permease